MPNQRYGITFPFVDSQEGFFLGLNKFTNSEIKSNLIHLIWPSNIFKVIGL